MVSNVFFSNKDALQCHHIEVMESFSLASDIDFMPVLKPVVKIFILFLLQYL